MEISGKVLREVEFRDRLRGYDTDEVDEFLEKVAIGIDELRAELAVMAERVEEAKRAGPVEHKVPDTFLADDDAIRRTLVLAQRTADLAISEAREEASRLTEEARLQSETLVSTAQESSRRMREEAEFEAHERVDRLNEQRDRLERDIQTLAALVGGERERLTAGLQSALRFVAETLALSEELAAVATSTSTTSAGSASGGGYDQEPNRRKPLDEVMSLPDVEVEIAEDAHTAFGSTAPAPEPPRTTEARDAADPDEELWARWAEGAGLSQDEPEAGSRRETER